MASSNVWQWFAEGVLVIFVVMSIVAIPFLIFSFRFSLGPTSEFEKWKNSENATTMIFLLNLTSLFIVPLVVNELLVHFSWIWFVMVAAVFSLVVSLILKIDPASWRWQRAVETFPVPPGFGDQVLSPGSYYDCKNKVIRGGYDGRTVVPGISRGKR